MSKPPVPLAVGFTQAEAVKVPVKEIDGVSP